MTDPLDLATPLTKLGLGPASPPPEALLAARTRIDQTAAVFLEIGDEALELPWEWRAGEPPSTVRDAFYRAFETVEAAEVDLRRARAEAGARATAAGRIVGQAIVALWDLHGVLVALSDADLDRPPPGAEWRIRRTLAHIMVAQYRYVLSSAYAAAHPDPITPQRPPDHLMPPNAAAEPWMPGTLAELRARLDETLDIGVALLGSIDDDATLAAMAVWSGYDVRLRFRLHRWSAHFREHTIQVDKTLEMLGRQPREVERITRHICGAYGRLEAALREAPLDERLLPIVDRAVDAAHQMARTARAAAG